MSYGGRIAILPGQSKAEEFSTLVHETAHELLQKAVGLITGTASADYIQLYHGNASLLAESLEVIQQTASVILAALEPAIAEEDTAGTSDDAAAELAEVA